MGISVHWSWLAVLSCLLCMGGEVRCDCTEEGLQMEGGHYILTKELQRGSVLVYYCPDGYYPYPDSSRVCQLNRKWKPAPKKFSRQRCRVVECPDPNVLENGNVSPPQEKYFVGNETTYECYSGYTMRGSSRRVCMKNGKWNGSTPICSRDSWDTCADPGIPPGASRTGNIFGIDDKVTYTCNSNLLLVGSSERVCQETGQWTGKEPACYYKYTYDTPQEVSEEFGGAMKDLTTSQSIDDTQQARNVKISKNETLNIYIAVDISESIEKDHFISARDAVAKLITKISSFTVSPNYEIVFFSSQVTEVFNILDFFDREVKRNEVKNAVENFEVEPNTNTGTDLSLVFHTFWERMALIKERVGDEGFKKHHHVIIVFTDGAYNMGGSPVPTVKKIKNMVYMNHTSEKTSHPREEYLDIYVFAIGAEVFAEDLMPLTTGTGGRHYFRMTDFQMIQEIFDEIIDADEVKGLCGLYNVTGNDPDKLYPWLAFIFNSKTTKKCLGSLVTPKFVLTAAHCFTFGDLPEDVTVEIDDGHGIVKRVKTFKLHPNYNVSAKANKGVKEFYDYDVALIQLEEAVHISINVRPICIPCTQETSDALKLVGASTCLEQEQLLFKNHIEYLNFLTKKERKIEKKDVHAKLGDNRDECIKHALKAPGITTDDPREAVTDNFLCTGGRTHYRDHIACTGDSGGAVFKDYEHRTIQVALVSWGTKSLCKSGGLVESQDDSRDFHLNLFRVVPFLKSILGDDDQDYAPLTFLKS